MGALVHHVITKGGNRKGPFSFVKKSTTKPIKKKSCLSWQLELHAPVCGIKSM